MPIILLKATTFWLLKPFALLLGWIFNGLFYLLSQVTVNQCLALTIILFTFLVRAALMPLSIRQQRASRRQAKLQPKIEKIQAKYAGKSDPESQQRMSMEMQQLYKENKYNPMSGCLPLLIQMPILFALYEVLRNVPFYVSQIGDIYESMAATVQGISGYADVINSEAFSGVVKGLRNFDVTEIDSIIDFLYHLSRTQWSSFMETLGLTSDAAFVANYQLQESYNTFRIGSLLFNLNESPGWRNWGWIFPVLAGGTTFLQSFLSQRANDRRQRMVDPNFTETQQQQSMKMMMYIFPLLTLWFVSSMPLGLGIYWIASNVFGMLSQWISDAAIDREDYKAAVQRRDELIARKAEEAKNGKSKADKMTGGRMGTAKTQSKSALAGNRPAPKPVKKETTDEAFARLTKEAEEREEAEKAAKEASQEVPGTEDKAKSGDIASKSDDIF